MSDRSFELYPCVSLFFFTSTLQQLSITKKKKKSETHGYSSKGLLDIPKQQIPRRTFFSRLPNRFRKNWRISTPINLKKIQFYIEKKRIDSKIIINSDLLKKLNIINKNSVKLKILGNGQIKEKINIEADLISKSAKEELEKIGGSIQIKKK